jgi:orotidine-5'-phosphate decarboxylase
VTSAIKTVAIQAGRGTGVLFPTVSQTASAVQATSFAARLHAKVKERGSQVVLGLDPDPADLWPLAADAPHGTAAAHDSAAARVAALVQAHCAALIDAAGPACVAVKPQLARFEALGAAGWRALEATVAYARQVGLLVIADAKRGDIDVTASAYAEALMGATATPEGAVEGLGVDMVTVNPLMGRDTLTPFVEVARRVGGGVLVLVRTSNPGAVDVEDLELAGGGTVWERIAALVDELGRAGETGTTGAAAQATAPEDTQSEVGLSDVGAVVGATAPEHLAKARELMPKAVFLLPGVGAQGGRVQDLAPAFQPGRAGGLVTASRSIATAHRKLGGSPAAAARAEAERLREQAWALSSGV